MSTQNLIDSILYPPTMTYTLDPLEPTGVLAERVAIMDQRFPSFFERDEECGRFLDVGASKGFFTLMMRGLGFSCVAIDKDKALCELYGHLQQPRADFIVAGIFGFSKMPHLWRSKFSRIMLGNVHHHLFRDWQGWDWIAWLDRFAARHAKVLVEGPLSLSCTDVRGCIPESLWPGFQKREFFQRMGRHFPKRSRAYKSPAYTPDRYMILWER